MAEQINVDFDPQKVLDAVRRISTEMKECARVVDETLGKDAPKAIGKLEEASENGANRIKKYFKNLAHEVREDLKEAFAVGEIAAGLKIGSEFAKGITEVFSMEKAFDRLNTRLGLTNKEFSKFKNEVNKKVSGTGADLSQVLPGVETVAAKGGVKDSGQLASISEMLGQAAQITGENTDKLAESVVEIIRSQGKKVTAESFRETLNAVQGARTAGTFGSAGQAASELAGLSKFTGSGLNTRQLAGLAAQASTSGEGGVGILKQILERGQGVGGKEAMNSLFGANVFKGGKLNAEGLGNIDLTRFKGLSKEQMASATGFEGAAGSDFVRFVEAFKGGQENLKRVLGGADENNKQFGQATDNLVGAYDKFKEKTKAAGREIGDALTEAGGSLLKGNFKEAAGHIAEGAQGAFENKGVLAGAAGASLLGATMLGGGLRKLLPKGGGLAEGLVEGKALQAAGVQPVFVVNAAEIGSQTGGMLSSVLGQGDKLSKFAGTAGKFLGGAGGVIGAAGAGYEIGSQINQIPGVSDAVVGLFDKIGHLFGGGIKSDAEIEAQAQKMADAMKAAMKDAKIEVKNDGPHTNPSAVTGRGSTR